MQVEIITLSSMSPELLKNKEILIRCKDCKHGNIYCTEDTHGETLYECNINGIDDIEIHRSDWFCADGEPKDGEQE